MSVLHLAVSALFFLNCVALLQTHRLLAVVCCDRLRNVVGGSSFKRLQGREQFLLLPEQKDDILSSAASPVVPDLHISGEGWLTTVLATLINYSSRSEGKHTINFLLLLVSTIFVLTLHVAGVLLPLSIKMYRVFKCCILSTYLGPISVILCMAKLTLLSFLSWELWCTKPFIIWCALP